MSANDLPAQRRKWITKAPLGLVLTGLGASMISDAAVRRAAGAPYWIPYGTLSLIVFNSGLSILADAAKHKAHIERLEAATEATGD